MKKITTITATASVLASFLLVASFASAQSLNADLGAGVKVKGVDYTVVDVNATGTVNVNPGQERAAKVRQNGATSTKLSGILSSRPRLYVPVATKGGCAAAAANDGQARAELDGQTVEDLIKLVAEGDRAIIELNSCIDRYNQVKDTLDGHR